MATKKSNTMAGFLPERCVNTWPTGMDTLYAPLLATMPSPDFLALVDEAQGRFGGGILPPADCDEPTLRFVYSALSMMSHRYLVLQASTSWGILPNVLASPWCDAARRLGMPTVLTHAAVDLWNWSLKDPAQPVTLDNLRSNHTMTGSPEEEWFYLTMVAIEALGDPIMAALEGPGDLNQRLYTLADRLKQARDILHRLPERCSPDFFYHTLRPHLAGSEDRPLDLRDGLVVQFKGGSAAQSTLLQAVDLALDQSRGYPEHARAFLKEMRDYMPWGHRMVLHHLKPLPIQAEHRDAYRTCLAQLAAFRKAHFGIVHRYVFQPARADQPPRSCWTRWRRRIERGTGGTNPRTFLTSLFTHNDAAARV